MQPVISCVSGFGSDLGESLHWDASPGLLYWIDAWKSVVHAHDPLTGTFHQTDFSAALDGRPIGSVASMEGGGLIAAVKGGFYRLVPGTGEAVLLAKAEQDGPATNRLNDGKADRKGRFWSASINTDRQTASGRLWRFDGGDIPRLMESGFVSGNGIAWSPDNRTMYLADSFARLVLQYDFDFETGEIANRRPFIDARSLGVPDGATVDADGCYWTALFEAGSVGQFDPDGRLIRRISLPATYVTMCSFGGADLDTLYVTSATRFYSADWRSTEPQAGHLFAIEGLGVRGLAEAKFRGSPAAAP